MLAGKQIENLCPGFSFISNKNKSAEILFCLFLFTKNVIFFFFKKSIYKKIHTIVPIYKDERNFPRSNIVLWLFSWLQNMDQIKKVAWIFPKNVFEVFRYETRSVSYGDARSKTLVGFYYHTGQYGKKIVKSLLQKKSEKNCNFS